MSVAARAAPDDGRIAPAAVARVGQLQGDDAIRTQVVQVLEDYAAQLVTPATERADARYAELTDERRSIEEIVRDPDSELAEILEAFHTDHDDEAFTLLAEFREAWPDHPVTMTLTERGL